VEKQAKTGRLSAGREISFLNKTGLYWKCSCFSIVYVHSKRDHDRAAVIVSKKNGNAVQRNRIKRIFKEIIRNNTSNTSPYFDILIKPVGILLPPAEELKSSFLTWENMVKRQDCSSCL
jgi:ribonuclease P protein component